MRTGVDNRLVSGYLPLSSAASVFALTRVCCLACVRLLLCLRWHLAV